MMGHDSAMRSLIVAVVLVTGWLALAAYGERTAHLGSLDIRAGTRELMIGPKSGDGSIGLWVTDGAQECTAAMAVRCQEEGREEQAPCIAEVRVIASREENESHDLTLRATSQARQGGQASLFSSKHGRVFGSGVYILGGQTGWLVQKEWPHLNWDSVYGEVQVVHGERAMWMGLDGIRRKGRDETR